MSRYEDTFSRLGKEGRMAFMPFWMLGYPDEAQSLATIEMLAEHADILELGIPFSDPLADGPVLQAAATKAIEAGMTTKKALELVKQVRTKFPDKPIGLLVYLNLILKFGPEEFFAQCSHCGVDSVLIPELPVEEISLVEKAAKMHHIDLVFLVSTNTPEDRLSRILEHAGGFLYAISTPSTTGAKSDLAPETLEMIGDLKKKTDLPVCVGFGISTPEHIGELKKAGADGAIVGSKLFSFEKEEELAQFIALCRTAR